MAPRVSNAGRRLPASARTPSVANLTAAERIALYPASFGWLAIHASYRHAYLDERIADAFAAGAQPGVAPEELRGRIDIARGVADWDESMLLWHDYHLRAIPGVETAPERKWEASFDIHPPLRAIARQPATAVARWFRFAVRRVIDAVVTGALKWLARVPRHMYWNINSHNIVVSHAGCRYHHLHQLPLVLAVATFVRWVLHERAYDRRVAARNPGGQ